jgi:GH18 family chitinase
MATASSWDAIQHYKNVSLIAQYVDYVNLVTYELQGYWNNKTGLHTQLYSGKSEVNYFVEKILMAYWKCRRKLIKTYKENFSIC